MRTNTTVTSSTFPPSSLSVHPPFSLSPLLTPPTALRISFAILRPFRAGFRECSTSRLLSPWTSAMSRWRMCTSRRQGSRKWCVDRSIDRWMDGWMDLASLDLPLVSISVCLSLFFACANFIHLYSLLLSFSINLLHRLLFLIRTNTSPTSTLTQSSPASSTNTSASRSPRCRRSPKQLSPCRSSSLAFPASFASATGTTLSATRGRASCARASCSRALPSTARSPSVFSLPPGSISTADLNRQRCSPN